jgi:uncharacterized repeat protein (TIGR01451 family)
MTEASASFDADGRAPVKINQPLAKAGTNRIAVEVTKPDKNRPGEYLVVSRGETKVTWQSPQLNVKIDAPKLAGLNQDYAVLYTVAGSGTIPTENLTVNATIPEGMELLRTEPKAAIDGRTLIWTLPGLGAGQQQTLQAVYQPTKVGASALSLLARSPDGLRAEQSSAVKIGQGNLNLDLEGPGTGVAGEALPYRVVVTNTGDGSASNVRVRVKLDDGLELDDKANTLNKTIDFLLPGQSRTIELPANAKGPGNYVILAGAIADGDLKATPKQAKLAVQQPGLSVSAHGPTRAFVGQEVSWDIVARNTGDVDLGNAVLKVDLPPETTLVNASDDGKLVGRQIVWKLSVLPARQEVTVRVTGLCNKLTEKSNLYANVEAVPVVRENKTLRTVSMVKPFKAEQEAKVGLEIVGIPALQLSVKDSVDPVGAGQRVLYTIKISNAGTTDARKCELVVDAPPEFRVIRATGASATGKVTGQRIVFPTIETFAPGAEATYTVELEADAAGQARFRCELKAMNISRPIKAEEPTRILSRETSPR